MESNIEGCPEIAVNIGDINIEIDKVTFDFILNLIKQTSPNGRYLKLLALPLFKILMYNILKDSLLLDDITCCEILNMNKPIINRLKRSNLYLEFIIERDLITFFDRKMFHSFEIQSGFG